MSLAEIKDAVDALSADELAELREWFENHLEVTDEFAASIERGKNDIVDGNVRVREPERA